LEAGYAISDDTFWIGVFAPARTPEAIVAKLNAALIQAVQMPDLKARLDTLGVVTADQPPAAFGAMVKDELATYGAFARATGMKTN
jgi:tripartite-type tricarboxylate transporter receptor subunit TctC